jgi:hypothetical protein
MSVIPKELEERKRKNPCRAGTFSENTPCTNESDFRCQYEVPHREHGPTLIEKTYCHAHTTVLHNICKLGRTKLISVEPIFLA